MASPPPPPAVWGYTTRARAAQAKRYAEQLKHHFSVAEHHVETEERRARHAAVCRTAFAGCRGAPAPPDAWDVSVVRDAAGGAKFKYSHPNFHAGRAFYTLATLVRELGEEVLAKAAPGAPVAPAPPEPHGESPSPRPAAPVPESLDATRALEQVQQFVAADGATARIGCWLPLSSLFRAGGALTRARRVAGAAGRQGG